MDPVYPYVPRWRDAGNETDAMFARGGNPFGVDPQCFPGDTPGPPGVHQVVRSEYEYYACAARGAVACSRTSARYRPMITSATSGAAPRGPLTASAPAAREVSRTLSAK